MGAPTSPNPLGPVSGDDLGTSVRGVLRPSGGSSPPDIECGDDYDYSGKMFLFVTI